MNNFSFLIDSEIAERNIHESELVKKKKNFTWTQTD